VPLSVDGVYPTSIPSTTDKIVGMWICKLLTLLVTQCTARS